MKKIFVQTLFAVLLTGSLLANTGVTVNHQVKKSFEKEFAGAQAVTWESLSSRNIFHASFIINNERLNAYFNNEGELIATGRYIKSENLPLLASKAVAARFSKHEITEAIEYIAGNETSYIVKLNGPKNSISAQVFLGGNIAVLKKEKKK